MTIIMTTPRNAHRKGVKPTSYTQAQKAEQRNEVLRMRIAGKSLRQIHEALGITKDTAARREKEALAETLIPERDEIRRLEVARLDDMIELMYDKVAVDGDEKAAAIILRCMERRAKMLGLDEAMQVEVKTSVLTSFDQEMAALTRELGLNDPSVQSSATPVQPA